MKESQVKKVTKEILIKYGKETDKVISECAQKVQSSDLDEGALTKLWSEKLTSMRQKERESWAEILENTENAKQTGFLGCLVDPNAPITRKKSGKEEK